MVKESHFSWGGTRESKEDEDEEEKNNSINPSLNTDEEEFLDQKQEEI